MTTLKDLLRDVQVFSIGVKELKDMHELTGMSEQDYKDRLQEILDEAERRILIDLLGVEL